MHISLRRSFSAKITAIGFILFILFGNFRLLHQMTAAVPATWIQNGFTLSLALVAIGGLGLGIQALFLPRKKTDSDAETHHHDEHNSL